MAMTGFICHDDYYNRLQRLTDEEVGHLFRNLMLYHAGKIEDMTDFVGVEGIAFDFIKDDIDRMEEKAKKTEETNRLNGMKGGRPKKQTEPEETEENRQKPTETEQNPTKAYKDKDKDKENIKEKENEREPQKRFTPPTVDEVAAYCKERGNGIDPQYFVDYHIARNWVLSNGKKMADWRATVRTWEGKSFRKPDIRAVPAQGYHQRDYSGETEAAFLRMMEGEKDHA